MRLAVEETGTENLFETLANESPVGLYIIQDGKFCYTNPTFQSTTGYKEDELLGRDALGLVVPEDREQVRENAIKMLKGERTLPYQFRVTHKNGSIKWVIESVVSIQYRGRRATLGDFVDITERKQAEEKVQHLNMVLRAIRDINQLIARGTDRDSLLKGACDIFVKTRGYYSAWIALLDSSGKLVTAAEAGLGKSFLQIMEKLKRGELTHCGRKVLEKPGILVIKDVSSECEDCPVVKEDTGRDAMSVRLEHGGKVYGLMTVSISPDRSAEKEEQNLLEEISGDIAFALHSMEQEQERKRVEEKLREGEEKYRTIFENVSEAIIRVDRYGKILDVNGRAEEVFGYKPEEVIGKNFAKISVLSLKDMPKIVKLFGNVIRGKHAPFMLELEAKRKDGSRVLVEVDPKLVKKNGKAEGVVAIIRDITERKQAEEALQASEEMYKTVVEDAPIGIYYNDFKGTFLYGNKKAGEIVGYKLEELLGKSFLKLKLLRPEGIAKAAKLLALNKLGKATGPDLFTLNRKDGTTSIVEIRTKVSTFSGKKAVLGMVEDITERKKAEEALSRTQAQLSSAVQIAHLGPWEYDAINDLFIFNDAFYELFHTTAEEVGGYTMSSDEYARRFVHPEDAHLVAEEGHKALQQADDPNFSRQFDHRIIYADGEIGYVSVRLFIRKDEIGRAVGIYGVDQDITERKRAEEALQAEKNKLQSLIDAIEDTITIQDTEYNIIYQNEPSRIASGGDHRGEKCYQAYEGRESICEGCPVEKAFKDGKSHTAERKTAIEAKVAFWENTANPVRDAEGRIVSCIELARDITERKKQEQALADELTRRRLLIDQSLDGIVVLDVDAKVVESNRRFAEMLGYTLEEVHKLHTWDWDKNFPPEKILEMGQNVDEKGLHLETKHTRKDGSVIDVDISINAAMCSGQKLIFCVCRDVTERKKMEEALKLAAEEWRETFDSIGDAISIHDRDFRILRANKAFADIFHMKPNQIIDKHCYKLHSGEKPISGCPHKQTLATKQPAEAEFYESHLGKYLHESTSPIFDEKGEVVGTVHITRDITEQKQQNERLMMADRLASIGELAAGTAHELNNPLTSVLGFSQLVMEKDIPDDIREDLKLIYNEAQRAANVTKNLLTFGRKHAPVKHPNQINNIIEDVLKLRAYEHKINSIEVKRQLAPDLPEIMVDYFQMQQVFLNIIINAEHFMTEAHKRGTLTITTKKQNSTVRISIADDGPGIPRENLSRIFNPFFTTKEAGKGTGLGLSICHGIVSEHGGQIYARSQPGKGATIVVELPTNNH
jgi:PAS domain S-box-containing protein